MPDQALTDAQRAALEPYLTPSEGETLEFQAASIVHIAETFLDIDVPSEEAVLAELRSRG